MTPIFDVDNKNTEKNEEKGNKQNASIPKQPNVDINQYKDLEGITMKKLNFGMWYVRNRQTLARILFYLLLTIATVFWVYFIASFSLYIFKGTKINKDIIQNLISSNLAGHQFTSSLAAQDLVISPVETIKVEGNKYNFIVKIENRNKDFWARFNFYFLVNGQKYGEAKSFILPDQSKYLLDLGQSTEDNVSTAAAVITDLNWQRINPHFIPSWKNFAAEHMNVAIEDIIFTPASGAALGKKTNFNNLKFTVANYSPYNYRDIDLTALFKSGNKIEDAFDFKVENLMSKGRTTVEKSWSGNLPSISTVDIKPQIDLFNSNNYLKFEGETQ